MTPGIVGITILLYLVALLLSSRILSRKVDNKEFFGKKSIHWSIVGIAMISAAMSGITFISVPGSVAENGFSYLQMSLGFLLGNIFISLVLIPLFYKTNVISLYEYLNLRFGVNSHKCGAWLFFISKIINASLRTLIISSILQHLLFEPLSIPFWVNALLTLLVVWLYTHRGGVKSVIWGDVIKTICLVGSTILCIILITKNIGASYPEMVEMVASHPYSRIFFFDDINDKRHFFKQFLAGFFMIIATTGLDQDVMQRVLSCRTQRESQRNMIISIFLQIAIIVLLLSLGTLLYIYVEREGFASVGESLFPLTNGNRVIMRPDMLFSTVANSNTLPIAVGILFILGVSATTFSSAGSAVTSLTTSFTVDILHINEQHDEYKLTRIRKGIHLAITAVIALLVIAFYYLTSDSIINTFYKIASYSYGPILGMFAFGIASKRKVKDRYVPFVIIISPILSLILDNISIEWFGGYEFSFELLVINALITIAGLYLLSTKNDTKKNEK